MVPVYSQYQIGLPDSGATSPIVTLTEHLAARLRRLTAVQKQRVRYDAHRREGHRGAGDHRVEQPETGERHHLLA